MLVRARKVGPIRAIRSFHAEDSGQTVVLVALMFTLLLGFGAAAIDVGRFYAERRYVQDAVDAAAIACAFKYATSGTDATQAWNAGDDILKNHNLIRNPLGIPVAYAAKGAEVYDNAVVTDQNLNSGILPVLTNGLGCRVAITVDVPTYLLKLLNPNLAVITVTTRAYAKAKGGFLPSVVQRYANPSDTDDNPIDDAPNDFIDHTAAAGQDGACHAGSNYLPGCTPATLAAPGAEFDLMGAGAKATNDSAFRGYIGLDVRNYQQTDPLGNLIHDSYNGVAQNATVNTLKAFEASWIDQGYPGPDLCAVQSASFLPCGEVAVIDGSSSGIFVTDYQNHFQVGDIVMLQLYDGTVKTVPDFTINPPQLSVPSGANQAVPNKNVAYTFSSQFQASGSQVCTFIIPDDGTDTTGVPGVGGDTTGTNPFMGATPAVTYTPSPTTCPGGSNTPFNINPTPPNLATYNQTWTGMTANGASQGLYVVFLRGKATAPYTTRIHDYPVVVNVGNQQKQYSITSSDSQQSVSVNPGPLPATVNWNIVLTTASTGSTQWPGGQNITISWEQCPRATDTGIPLASCYIGSVGTTSKSVAVGTTTPVTVNTTGAQTQTTYLGWVRAVGYDAAGGKPVVRLWPIFLQVDQQTGGTTTYIDVLGYAAFQITQMTSNDVYGKAVSKAVLDPNDSAVAVGRKIGLVPWETP